MPTGVTRGGADVGVGVAQPVTTCASPSKSAERVVTRPEGPRWRPASTPRGTTLVTLVGAGAWQHHHVARAVRHPAGLQLARKLRHQLPSAGRCGVTQRGSEGPLDSIGAGPFVAHNGRTRLDGRTRSRAVGAASRVAAPLSAANFRGLSRSGFIRIPLSRLKAKDRRRSRRFLAFFRCRWRRTVAGFDRNCTESSELDGVQ
jgi:hypothetical protein